MKDDHNEENRMVSDDDKYRKKNPLIDSNHDDESGTGENGQGGKGGAIEFVDFLDTNQGKRDDLLPEDEKRRLLIIHKDIHESKVKRQKELRDQIKQLKNGKVSLNAYRAAKGAGSGGSSQFKQNPALVNYGHGVDPKVIGLPNENTAETNPENRDQLLNELRYRLGYQPSPKFNPKPSGPY